ncbi:hypothetical protein [Nonomuraea sp. NPDC049141]|uniref:hypothetical protein n=1 Tax=unclassified Nonomuraea TaxID=2593643 RepID=UPI0033F4D01C
MNEKELRSLLVKATEDRPAGIDLMPTPPKRGLARVLVPIASLAAAVVLGAFVLILPSSQSSAQAQVAAAVENTGQESYRLHCVSGAKTFDGAFDPVQRVGVITRVGDGAETRFVGDLMYSREPGEAKWMVSPRVDEELKKAPAAVGLVKLAPLDPQAALQRLRSATDIRESGSAAGQGWTGRRFAFSLGDAEDLTGSVDVDDQGRVRRLEFVFGDTGHRNVMDFNDFGASVTVTAPPADQVEPLPADKQMGKPIHKPT